LRHICAHQFVSVGQRWYNTGTIQVQYRDNAGITQVQYRYKSVSTQVQHRHNLGTIQARYRYNTVSIKYITGTTQDTGGTLWYIVWWTNMHTQCHCQQKPIYLYSLPICFCSLSTLALHPPSLSQVEKRPTILQIKLTFMYFVECNMRYTKSSNVPRAWTESDFGTKTAMCPHTLKGKIDAWCQYGWEMSNCTKFESVSLCSCARAMPVCKAVRQSSIRPEPISSAPRFV